MRYTVILDVRLKGESFATTEDQFEADSAEQAERIAISAWKASQPGCSFHPLLTLGHEPRT